MEINTAINVNILEKLLLKLYQKSLLIEPLCASSHNQNLLLGQSRLESYKNNHSLKGNKSIWDDFQKTFKQWPTCFNSQHCRIYSCDFKCRAMKIKDCRTKGTTNMKSIQSLQDLAFMLWLFMKFCVQIHEKRAQFFVPLDEQAANSLSLILALYSEENSRV